MVFPAPQTKWLGLPALAGVKTLGIRWHLAGLVAGCVLPIAVVAVFLILNYYEIEQKQLTDSATSRARALSTMLDQDLSRTEAALRVLGTSHRLATGDLSGFGDRALEALQNIHAENIVVWRADGRLLLSSSQSQSELPNKPYIPPALKTIIDKGEPGVSEMFVDPVTGHNVFSVVMPVKRDGELVYSLTANVAPRQISPLLTGQGFPGSWRVTIVDSTGSVVMRSHDIEKFQGRKLSAALLQSMKTASSGSQEGSTLDGIPVLTVFSKSQTTRWGIVLGIPLHDLTAGLNRSLVWLIGAALAALLIGITWAWHFGGRVAESVKALIEPARSLGSGAAVAIPRLHFREANKLGEALVEAANALAQSDYRAHHDGLTGLANRTLFEAAVNGQLALCRRNQTKLAILYIDLDGFKAVNDQYGHDTGDQLLCEVARRITASIRESDIAARLGGDEFAVALINAEFASAQAFGNHLITTLSQPYQFADVQTSIAASIGVAGYPDSAADMETLLIRADRAMYRAKEQGKGRLVVA